MGNTEKNTFSIPTQQELEQLSELHKTMGDYSRMKILWLLTGQELCVSDLAKQMNITKSAVSHQLRELRITRLVQSHRVGKNVFYSLSDEHIQWVLEETYAHISER